MHVSVYLVQVERRVGESVNVDVAVPPAGVDDAAATAAAAAVVGELLVEGEFAPLDQPLAHGAARVAVLLLPVFEHVVVVVLGQAGSVLVLNIERDSLGI